MASEEKSYSTNPSSKRKRTPEQDDHETRAAPGPGKKRPRKGGKCEENGCTTTPGFGEPGGYRQRCAKHKIEGDVCLTDKLCEHDSCGKRAAYGPRRTPVRCIDHRLSTDISSSQKWCLEAGCTTQPRFGRPGGEPVRCGKHKIDVDQNIVSKRCSSVWCLAKQDVFSRGYAYKRNPESGEIDLCGPCYKKTGRGLSNGGVPKSNDERGGDGETGQNGRSHSAPQADSPTPSVRGPHNGGTATPKRKRDVEDDTAQYLPEQDEYETRGGKRRRKAKLCENDTCGRRAAYGPGRTGVRCRDHRLPTDVDSRQKWCLEEGCTTQPRFGKPGGEQLRCGRHRIEGDRNIGSKRCSSVWCLAKTDVLSRGPALKRNPETGKNDLCRPCYRKLFPNHSIPSPQRANKRKRNGGENRTVSGSDEKRQKTRGMICGEVGCMESARFGNRGEAVRRCAKHRIDGDADLMREVCEQLGCVEQVEYGTDTVAVRCGCHRLTTDVKSRQGWCAESGCLTPPIFGTPGCGAKRCGGHRIDGDQDVVSRRCASYWCIAQDDISSMGYATQTNPETGDVDLCRSCLEIIFPDSLPTIRGTICEASACQKRAYYGPGRQTMRCIDHRLNTDVGSHQKWCIHPGCTVTPGFGRPGGEALRCGEHRIEGDQNIVSRRCSSETCLTYEDIFMRGYAKHRNPETGKRELCSFCFSVKFPSGTIAVRREQFVLAEVQRCIPELEPHFVTWDCKIPGQSCNSDKPDMVWKIGGTLLHIEIDEKGDDHEDNRERIVGIHAASNCNYHLLIRFNPDRSANGRPPCMKKITMPNGTKVYERDEKEWLSRIPVLISEVKSAYNSCVEDGDKVKTGVVKLFF